jgi:hypothetical protein
MSGAQNSIFDLFDYRCRVNGFLYRLNSYLVGFAARSELLFDQIVAFCAKPESPPIAIVPVTKRFLCRRLDTHRLMA